MSVQQSIGRILEKLDSTAAWVRDIANRTKDDHDALIRQQAELANHAARIEALELAARDRGARWWDIIKLILASLAGAVAAWLFGG